MSPLSQILLLALRAMELCYMARNCALWERHTSPCHLLALVLGMPLQKLDMVIVCGTPLLCVRLGCCRVVPLCMGLRAVVLWWDRVSLRTSLVSAGFVKPLARDAFAGHLPVV
ncbi:hypothetical protein DFH06DRAFT_282751 [Mycena polygramma]|nr:hypothetical protein DFH06DRAFT_282751 [Mycena polygramma]